LEKKVVRYCINCGSKLRVRKEEGRERFFCPTCGWVNYENPLPCAAAFVRNKKGEILLVKRGVVPEKGKWALPSGFVEIDETTEQACLRELEEETGMKGKLLKLIGVYSQKSLMYKNVIIVGYHVEASGRPSAGSDSQSVDFFSSKELPEIAFSSHVKIIEDGLEAGKE